MSEPAGEATDGDLNIRIAAAERDVAAFLKALAGRIYKDKIDAADYEGAIIVLGEVLNNIVEHAYRDRTDGHIVLRLARRGDRLEVETEDEGHPLPLALLGGAKLPANDVALDDLPEGGFGWFIIHSMVDDMTYERGDGTNKLAFSFPSSSATPPGAEARTG